MRSRLTTGRLGLAARCVGVAQAGFEIALEFMKDREIAGKAGEGTFPLWAQLGEIASKFEACRAPLPLCCKHARQSGEIRHQVVRPNGRQGFGGQAHGRKMVLSTLSRVMEFMGSYGYALSIRLRSTTGMSKS